MSKKIKNKIAVGGLTAFFIVVLLVAIYGISWIGTCGIIKLITMCFGWTFKWSIATGIWLILLLLSSIFNKTSNSK